MPVIIMDLIHTPPASACQREDRGASFSRLSVGYDWVKLDEVVG